jgi:endonuclease YncB( thermonuclease family)
VTFLLVSVVTACLSVQANEFEGQVVAVSDGDTIKVLHTGAVTRVRLANIDCPEHDQAFGQRAKQFTSAYVFGKQVIVKDHGTDKYNRTIGEVVPLDSSIDLNHALIMSGLAWTYRKYCQDPVFYELESFARSQHKGLWADSLPMAPWDFRRQKKQLAINPNIERRH